MFVTKKSKIIAGAVGIAGAALVLGLGLGLGLTQNSSGGGASGKEIISLIISTRDNPFFTSLEKGVRDEVQKDGKYQLNVLNSNDDDGTQQTNITQALSIGSVAVLINPVNSTTAAAQLKTLFDNNIPVFALDRSVNNTDQVKQTIATDNVQAAQQVVSQFVSDFAFDASSMGVFHLQGVDGAQASIDRNQGFRQGLGYNADQSFNFEQRADFNRAMAVARTTTLLSANSDNFKLIVADNDEMALGAIQAIESMNFKAINTKPLDTSPNSYYVIGFDGTDLGLRAVQAGTLSATVLQQPELIGSLGVQAALQLLKDPNASIPKTVGAAATIVTSANVGQFIS